MASTLCVAMMTGEVALAANQRAIALAREAERAFVAREYEVAAVLVRQAYELEPNPKFLYNWGRALELGGKATQALAAYRAYLALPAEDTTAAMVTKAKEAVERLQRSAAPAGSGEPPPEPLSSGTAKPSPPVAESVHRPRLGWRIAAIASGGVGMVGLGLGVAFGLSAKAAKERFSRALTISAKGDAAGATRSAALAADLAFAVGAAATVAAFIFFPLSLDGSGTVQVSASPAPAFDGAWATMRVTF